MNFKIKNMKSKIYIIAILFLCNLASFGQTPEWAWAKRAGGVDYDVGFSVTTDSSGYIYLAGEFSSDTIFFGDDTLVNNLATISDIFIAKYNPSGNIIWAKSAGGLSVESAFGIISDNHENIYVTGKFMSTDITFDTISFSNINKGEGDFYLAKYDTSGNVKWVRTAGGIRDDFGQSITVDDFGNIYVTGEFQSNEIVFENDTLTVTDISCICGDVFTVKYDHDGNVIWAKSANGEKFDIGYGISTDSDANVYVTGWFWSPTISFDGQTLTNASAGTNDIFIIKYDSSGIIQWVKRAGGADNDAGLSLSTDLHNNIYLTGYFQSSSISFDSYPLNNVGLRDVILVKYNPSGNVLFAKSAGGSNYDIGYGITNNPEGYVYITGWFQSSVFSFPDTTLINAGSFDIFVTKYDSLGNFIWAKGAGKSELDEGKSITADNFGNIYHTGFYNSPYVVFDQDTLNNPGTTYSHDIFLAKIGECSLEPPSITQIENHLISSNGSSYQWYLNGILIPGATSEQYIPLQNGTYTVVITDNSGCTATSAPLEYLTVNIPQIENTDLFFIYPNPSHDKFSLIVPTTTSQIQIINSYGQIVQHTISKGQTDYIFEIENNGIYYIQITTDKNILTKKIIVCK